MAEQTTATPRPAALYVWLVPSEDVQEQPGSWRIRMWDTEPFPEANFALSENKPNGAGFKPDNAQDSRQAMWRDGPASPAMSGQTNEGAGSADFWKAQYAKLAAAVDGGYYGEYPCADCPRNAPPSTGDNAPEPGAVDCPPAVDKG